MPRTSPPPALYASYVCNAADKMISDFKNSPFSLFVLSTRSDEEIFIPSLLNPFCTLWVCLPNCASSPFCFPHFSHCVTFCNWQEVRTSYLRTPGYYETLSNTELSSEIYLFSCNMPRNMNLKFHSYET